MRSIAKLEQTRSADLPVLHGFAHGNNLVGHIGAGYRVLLLEERELALRNEEIAVLDSAVG